MLCLQNLCLLLLPYQVSVLHVCLLSLAKWNTWRRSLHGTVPFELSGSVHRLQDIIFHFYTTVSILVSKYYFTMRPIIHLQNCLWRFPYMWCLNAVFLSLLHVAGIKFLQGILNEISNQFIFVGLEIVKYKNIRTKLSEKCHYEPLKIPPRLRCLVKNLVFTSLDGFHIFISVRTIHYVLKSQTM